VTADVWLAIANIKFQCSRAIPIISQMRQWVSLAAISTTKSHFAAFAYIVDDFAGDAPNQIDTRCDRMRSKAAVTTCRIFGWRGGSFVIIISRRPLWFCDAFAEV